MKWIINLLLIIFICVACISCSDRYQEGYENGYKRGYYEGHAKGHEEGHTDGYLDGTSVFVKNGITPSLGLVILVLVSFASLYFLYMHYKDPTKRVIDKSADKVEEIRQQRIAIKELERRVKSEEEIARAKANTFATKIFDNSKTALSEAYSEKEVEKIKVEMEERIFKALSSEIDKIIGQYEKTYESLKNTKHANSKEKAELFAFLKEVVKK